MGVSSRAPVVVDVSHGRIGQLSRDDCSTRDYCAAGHSHEALLRKTAEQQGIVLEGKLLECRGCFMANGLRKCIKQSTHTRADKKLGRVFV